MKNIVLIGMPGAGKTTFGRYLGELLGREFIDADEVVVARSGKTIKELFDISEDVFRDAESETVQHLATHENKVLAMGGGVVKRRENMEVLKKTGVIIFLDRSPEAIISDVDTTERPLLATGKEKIHELYKERKDLYEGSCDHIVKAEGTVKDVLQELLRIARECEAD